MCDSLKHVVPGPREEAQAWTAGFVGKGLGSIPHTLYPEAQFQSTKQGIARAIPPMTVTPKHLPNLKTEKKNGFKLFPQFLQNMPSWALKMLPPPPGSSYLMSPTKIPFPPGAMVFGTKDELDQGHSNTSFLPCYQGHLPVKLEQGVPQIPRDLGGNPWHPIPSPCSPHFLPTTPGCAWHRATLA